ncbi:MAG TPA: SDR family NAD(P)-dependent oxidoreductase [Burkholderiales bacterium]|nr:SDR family NAD(P)-dependent oxidoreductase [Burkholderiales bacterium]
MSVFRSKRVLITGGASGIGRGLAEALGAQGASVTVADLNPAGAQAVAEGIVQRGGEAAAVQLNVADSAAFERLVQSIRQLDYLFNCAGFAIVGEMRHMDMQAWRRIVDVNLMGVIAGSLAAYELMARQGHGHIVNIASLAGLVGAPNLSAYATTKAGVVMLTQMLRAEGEALGVKASAVCPGFIRTGIMDNAQYLNTTKETALAQTPVPFMELAPAIDRILLGVGRNEALIVFPSYARLLWRLLRWFPSAAPSLRRKLVQVSRARQ